MSGVTSIGQYAFCCRTMNSVFLQDGVKEIKDYAFGQCWSLYRVVIPDSVTSISDKAFDGLEGVVFYCSSNSYARKYADAHGIDVSLTDECHHAKYSIKVTKEAGCTENGTKSEICDSCGKVLHTFSSDAFGHSYGNWETKTNATVFEPEVQIRTCTRCGNTETRQAGGKLSPTIKVNTKSIKIKTGQTTSALKVSGLANGDYVKAYSSLNQNIATVDTQGRIKAGKKTGSTRIRIQLASGGCAYVQVTVQKKSGCFTENQRCSFSTYIECRQNQNFEAKAFTCYLYSENHI